MMTLTGISQALAADVLADLVLFYPSRNSISAGLWDACSVKNRLVSPFTLSQRLYDEGIPSVLLPHTYFYLQRMHVTQLVPDEHPSWSVLTMYVHRMYICPPEHP